MNVNKDFLTLSSFFSLHQVNLNTIYLARIQRWAMKIIRRNSFKLQISRVYRTSNQWGKKIELNEIPLNWMERKIRDQFDQSLTGA